MLKLSILFLMALSGCSEDSVQWEEWPVVPGAENIRVYDFEKDNARQLYFEVSAEYPSKVVSEFYTKKVKNPWVRCYQEMKWKSFGDATQTPPAFIHQMVLHWANYKNDRLLLLGIRYVSSEANYRKLPDNQTQNVYLVEYQEADLDDAISRLGLNCERT